MQPLSEKTSKTVAKIAIFIIWILAIIIAIPMAVFHELREVMDETGTGLKPYCTPIEEYKLYPEHPKIQNITNVNFNRTTLDDQIIMPEEKQIGLFQIYNIGIRDITVCERKVYAFNFETYVDFNRFFKIRILSQITLIVYNCIKF